MARANWKIMDESSHKTGTRNCETYESDGRTNLLWRPHTILLLLIAVIGLTYIAYFEDQKDDIEYNVKRGLAAAILMFLAFSITESRDGPFLWPHPAIWRLILYTSVLYELGLVFLLFQTAAFSRKLLTFADPALNQPLPIKTYGGNCTFWNSNYSYKVSDVIADKVDIFVFSHSVGWFFMTLVLRDVWLTNVISFGFELLEYTFEHQLSVFSECWWDHWILDFLLCNGLGIFLGLKCMKYMSIKEYNWHRLWNIQPRMEVKVKSEVNPHSWVEYKWKPTGNLIRWFFITYVTMMFLLANLNTFYLQHVLWVPVNHSLVTIRLVFYVLCGAVAIREAYDYAGGITKKLGQQSWIVCAIIITELLIVIKFGLDVRTIPFPGYIKYFWMCSFIFYIAWSIWKFQFKFSRVREWSKNIMKQINIGDRKPFFDIITDNDNDLSGSEMQVKGLRKRVVVSSDTVQ